MRPGTTTHGGRGGALALVLIGVVVPLAIAGLLAARVLRGDDLAWDLEVMRSVHDRAGLALDIPMTALSVVGGGMGLVVTVAAAVFALARTGRGEHALVLGIAVGGAAVIANVLKPIIARPRPDLWEHGYPASGYAFPSGHAATSMALAAAVTVLAWDTRWRWWALAGGTLFTLGVGMSRIYLGVHYPSDVVAGWCLGITWVTVLILLARNPGPGGSEAGNVRP